MSAARRLARWLRLVVTCLAFVVAAPPPAVVASAFADVVCIAGEEAREEARVEASSAPVPAGVIEDAPEPSVESPRLVSRHWLDNCALLL